MQTFLPYPEFARSAGCLDRQRLGKQRVEAWQVLHVLLGESVGWQNHPATLMWRGSETALALYGEAICREWRSRGYQDSMLERFARRADGPLALAYRPPVWLGNETFHRSHQSNLVRKLPAHYGPLFPGVSGDLPYVWPV